MSVKAVVVGDKSVGKSSLIKSFLKGNTNANIKDTSSAEITIKNTTVNIHFNEKAGWEKEEPKEPTEPKPKTKGKKKKKKRNNGFGLYRSETEADDEINAQIIVYDVSNKQSFDFINKWVYVNRTNAPTILIANKCDIFPNNIDGKEEILSYGYCRDYGNGLNIDVIMELCAKYYGQKKTGQEYAEQNNMEYFELSTKTETEQDINDVNAVFQCISELALAHKELRRYTRRYNMLRERSGSFRPTIWKAGYEKRIGEPPKHALNRFNGASFYKQKPMNNMNEVRPKQINMVQNKVIPQQQQQQNTNGSSWGSWFIK